MVASAGAIRRAEAMPPAPSPEQEAAWRRQLWQSIRRGDVVPTWRSELVAASASSLTAGGGRGSSGSSSSGGSSNAMNLFGLIGGGSGGASDGNDASTSHRPVALLLVFDLSTARHLAPLYTALRASASKYDPRLIIAPTVSGGCTAVARAMGSDALRVADCRRANAAYQLLGNIAEVRAERSVLHASRQHGGDGKSSGGGNHLGGGGGDADLSEWAAVAAAAEAASACSALEVELSSMLEATAPAFILAPTLSGGAAERPECTGIGGAVATATGIGVAGDSDGGEEEADDLDAAAARLALSEALRAAIEAYSIDREAGPAAGTAAGASEAAAGGGLVTLLEPPLSEIHLLEWLAVLPPAAISHWHTPQVDISIITRAPRPGVQLACSPMELDPA